MRRFGTVILLLLLCACSRFDPDRDSNLADLHVSVQATAATADFPESELGGALLKLYILVYRADTLVVGKTVVGLPQESYSFVFPRRNKTRPYVLQAYGSFITGEDTQHTDVWSILPRKRLRRLRAERLPHSFGARDWLGMDETRLDGIDRTENYSLTLRPLGKPCRLQFEGWRETDSYSVTLEDKTVIKLGDEGYDDYVEALNPVLPAGNPAWLCLFGDPSQTEITVTRERAGVTNTLTVKPVPEGNQWQATFDFDNND